MKSLDPSELVFIDESAAAIHRVPRYGRAPVGECARGTQPAGRYARLTMIGALSLRGFPAPMALDGAADTDAVVAYVEHIPTPTRTREAIEAAFADGLERITPKDAAGWFRHCGYTSAPN